MLQLRRHTAVERLQAWYRGGKHVESKFNPAKGCERAARSSAGKSTPDNDSPAQATYGDIISKQREPNVLYMQKFASGNATTFS